MAKLFKGDGVAKNFSVLALCNFAVHIFNFLINMYLARELGPNGFGEYGVFITWAAIIQSVSSLGIQQVTIRNIARDNENSNFHFFISLSARLIGFIFTIALFTVYVFIAKEVTPIFYGLVVLYAFFLFLWDTIQNAAFGMQKMASCGYVNALGSALFLLFLIIALHRTIYLYLVFVLLLVVQVIKDIYFYHTCKKSKVFLGERKKIDKTSIVHLIKESFPFYIIVVFSLCTTQFPVLFLSNNSNLEEVAYFNTANKLMVPLSMILQTLLVALFPKFVNDREKNPALFNKNARLSFYGMAFLGSVACFIISLFRNEIVFLIYGQEYASTGMVMLSQSWYVVYFSLLSFYGTILTSLNRDKVLATISTTNSLVWVPILWFASPYGATIMSYGFIIGSIINMLSNSIVVNKINGSIFGKKGLIIVNLSLFACVTLSLLINDSINLIYRCLICIILISISGACIYNFTKRR